MSTCIGCSCSFARSAGTGSRVLLATQVIHNLRGLQAALGGTGAVTQLVPGLLEVLTSDPVAVLATARRSLSSIEAAEVRAVVLGDEQSDQLLSAALTAPTLSQISARAEHADLLPLFADELKAFRSVYQPIVSLASASDAPIGYEALLRAEGPAGPVMPDAMFEAAASAGWLHVLDRVGRTTALRGAAGWLGDAQLFVNFLPTTIYRPEVCLRTTEEAALSAGLRLDQLVFEVTESEQINDIDHLADVFAYYRERGCRVALDDLGAGYSSLNMLVRLQPDVVKLDKDIVQQLPSAVSAAVIAAVVDITHSYGGQVLAECVETADQANAARQLGVDLGQGWFFGRPEERTRRQVSHKTTQGLQAGTRRSTSSALAHPGNDNPVTVSPELKPSERPAAPVGQIPLGKGALTALLTRSVDVSSSGITIVDMTVADQPLVYVNAAFEHTTGYLASEVLGRNCRFLQGATTDPNAVEKIREDMRAGRKHVGVLRNFRKDGSSWWNELRLCPIEDGAGKLTHYIGFQSDVTDRVEAEHRLAHLAFHDELTGLPNRALLMGELDRAIAKATISRQGLTVLFIDLDGFKTVNDRLGHAAGDLALTATAIRLRLALRDGDLLGRYGGDEFIAVLADVPAGQARSVAQRTADALLDRFHSPLDLGGRPVHLGVSIGVALFPEHGIDANSLVIAADKAMYAAKQAGRGRAELAGLATAGSPAATD